MNPNVSVLDSDKPNNKLTHLYRHYDVGGELLYVGISLSAITRLSQHKDVSSWANDIARVEIQTFNSREEARLAEKTAVAKEKPKYNIRLQVKENTSTPEIIVPEERSRVQLLSKVVRYNPVYKVEEIASILSISASMVRQLIESGYLHALEWEWWSERHQKNVPKYRITGWSLIDFLECWKEKTITPKLGRQ